MTNNELNRLFGSFCQRDLLDEALKIQAKLLKLSRKDAVHDLTHKEFFRSAQRTKNVSAAMRFVQVLPQDLAKPLTYNYVVKVCAQAGDLTNAQHAVDMMKSTGLTMDARHYTNLIQTCANVCNHEAAFRLYKEMLSHRVHPDEYVYCALITACAKSVQKMKDRPSQLVLMERAFQALLDMPKQGVQPDLAIWNTLITCSGRVGQLDRCFELLETLMSKGHVPCKYTYNALIDACIRGKQKDLAIRIFRRALANGFGDECRIYTLAVQACRCDPDQIDLDQALEIYNEMQRQNARPDQTFFGVLVLVASDAGNFDLAVQIHADMEAEGLEMNSGVGSSLLRSCLINNRLTDAWHVYQSMKAAKMMPQIEQCNQMINALGKTYNLSKVIECLQDMKEKNISPDQGTYAAVISSLQQLQASDLAIEVAKVMKRSGVVMDWVTCFVLLRICYNVIWGEGPERLKTLPVSWKARPEGIAILQTLYRGQNEYYPDTVTNTDYNWPTLAVTFYRDALAAGVDPDGKLLNYLFSCLRLPLKNKNSDDLVKSNSEKNFYNEPLSYGLEKEGIIYMPTPKDPQLSWRFDLRVKALLQESISIGTLPHFDLSESSTLDMRNMWPVVAEVYVLTVFGQLQQRILNTVNKAYQYSVTIQVQPFTHSKVLKISYHQQDESSVGFSSLTQQQEEQPHMHFMMSSHDIEEEHQTPESNAPNVHSAEQKIALAGLGVCGQLRRMGIRPKINAKKGIIIVTSKEITRWSRWWNTKTLQETSSSFNKNISQFPNLLEDQQRKIRMGGGGEQRRKKMRGPKRL